MTAANREILLVRPTTEHLTSYVAALGRGYSASSTRPESRFEDLRKIEVDSGRFLRSLDDPEAKAGPVQMPDGTFVARIPSFTRWIWDGEFAGSIGLRWLRGSAELPPTCMGHIGYSVVSWKRGLGYAKTALRLILPEASQRGLPHVDIVTAPENVASQRVILANGGRLVERFVAGPENGGEEVMRFQIVLSEPAAQLAIRSFEPGDEDALVSVFSHSVSEIAPSKYTADQISSWLACGPTKESLSDDMRSRNAFVATLDDEIVGWIDMLPDGLIDMFYCIPKASRNGAADLLYATALHHAKALGVRRLRSEASRFAESFFARHGWKVDEREVIVREGVEIDRAKMSVAIER